MSQQEEIKMTVKGVEEGTTALAKGLTESLSQAYTLVMKSALESCTCTEKKIAEIESEIKNLKESLAAAKPDLADAKVKVAALQETAVNRVAAKLAEAKQAISQDQGKLQTGLSNLEKKVDDMNKYIQDIEAELTHEQQVRTKLASLLSPVIDALKSQIVEKK